MKLTKYEMASHHRAAPCIHGYSPCPEDHATCVLFTCSICGCSEGELPSECPGFKVTEKIRDNFYKGNLDFKHGNFCNKGGEMKDKQDQIMTWVWFNYDGNECNEYEHEGLKAPFCLLMKESKGYLPGWYFTDESEDLHGPFSSFEEVTKLQKLYNENT